MQNNLHFGWTNKGNDVVPAAGLVAGTKVATSFGWRAVEALAEGDQVLTFDNGLQRVVAVTRVRLTCRFAAPESWPLLVPAGALGNSDDMVVLPAQAVMIESDLAEELGGDPFFLVAGAALDGICGVERMLPDGGLDIVVLTFAHDEVIFTKPGVLCHCNSAAARNSCYAVLSGALADDLVDDFYRQQAA